MGNVRQSFSGVDSRWRALPAGSARLRTPVCLDNLDTILLFFLEAESMKRANLLGRASAQNTPCPTGQDTVQGPSLLQLESLAKLSGLGWHLAHPSQITGTLGLGCPAAG